MTTFIKCKYCGRENELSEALEHQIEGQVLATERKKHQEEINKIKTEVEEQTKKKTAIDFELNLKRIQEEAKEEKNKNNELQEQLLLLAKELRQTKRDADAIKFEFEKKLTQEEDKIRKETREKAEEEHNLKNLEKDKKLQEALKVNEELRRKLEQGSQQTQGEVLEIELEEILRKEFPMDKISEVAKGVRGADIIQKVIDKHNRECGIILWESKNASWSNAWIGKLKEDQRAAKAQMAVLVTVNLPADVKNFTFKEGVWITNKAYAIGLAWALRINIAQVFGIKAAGEGKNEKMETLFNYLTGTEFKHRVEAIIEAFTNLQTDIEKERRYFQTKWAKQEHEIRKIIDNTQGMYGDLQGVTGRSLPEIKSLQIESGETK